MGVTRRVDVRVSVPLADWLDAYATGRGTSRSAVVTAALAAFRDLAASGVPDLPDLPKRDGRSARKGKVQAAGARASSSSGSASPASRPAGGAPAESRLEIMRARQERLNRGRG